MTEISKRNITELREKLQEIEESLNIESKSQVLQQLENESSKDDFWKDPTHAQQVMTQIDGIRGEISTLNTLKASLNTLEELLDELPQEEHKELLSDYEKLKEDISKFETLKFLSGKYDRANAILSIHSGQGGTEANDWAEMLFRMYTMYFEKQSWEYRVTHMVRGNETGISTATIHIKGAYAYGLLKKEHGTHRLVRLSPFNAQNLRQTSFAGVEVIPQMEELDREIEIPESDIEFKAVRSGGPGGQSVNKTSSAVQITHIPTGTVVHSSEERSQLQNRVKAMQILKAKLWKILEEERLNEISEIKGEHKVAGWGNQIRNYILHPYKLVKDLRTGIESSNPDSVLDGNLDMFVEAQVRMQ